MSELKKDMLQSWQHEIVSNSCFNIVSNVPGLNIIISSTSLSPLSINSNNDIKSEMPSLRRKSEFGVFLLNVALMDFSLNYFSSPKI